MLLTIALKLASAHSHAVVRILVATLGVEMGIFGEKPQDLE
jgi:hypothetical protein